MPDKPNEKKLMSMLERMGIVQKADSEDEAAEDNAAVERPRSDADFRSMLGPSSGDPARPAPAARQPVPGVTTPIMPGPQTADPASAQPVRQAEPERPRAQPQTTAQVDPARSQLAGTPQKSSVFSRGSGAAGEGVPPDVEQFEAPQELFAGERAPAENSADRYLEIDELYDALAIRSKRTDSIYLIEEYLHTLPDSLPDESRREIVSRIVSASGFDYDRLLGDGVLRVKMLKEYAERFAQYTEDYVAARNGELDDLDQQILRVRTLIESRRELHKKQFFAIEAEAQRLKDIITFISS